MSRPRYKIAGLMGLVVLAAIGLVAIRNLSEGWPRPALCLGLVANLVASVVKPLVGVSIGLNLVAPVIAIARKGRSRVMATGYAVGGWLYLGLSLSASPFTRVFDDLTNRYWVLINQAHQYHVFSENLEFGRYRIAGHCLSIIASGLAGSIFAWLLTRQPDDLSGPTTSPTGQS